MDRPSNPPWLDFNFSSRTCHRSARQSLKKLEKKKLEKDRHYRLDAGAMSR
jgi:hypothetical protein